jgi:ankyrin repeat protein
MKPGRLVLAVFLLSQSPCLSAEIHDAARQGDVGNVTKLLDQGVPPDAKDETGETALLTACLAGHADVVAILVKHGAGIESRNDRGLTPLHGAAYSGDIGTVRLLVESGAVVNDADNIFKVTPLIVAAEEGHADVISFLANRGADLERTERAGYSALSRAVFRDHPEAVEALFKAGAKCQGEDRIGGWAPVCQRRLAALKQ